MLSAARLTFRIHRFEIVAAILVAGAAALALLYFTFQVRHIGIPDGCWPRDVQGDFGLPECERLMRRFWALQSAGGGWTGNVLTLLGPILGVFLGVSIVAREVELRTAELAWSLSRRRSRWLLQRLVPMLGIALVILCALGLLGWWYFDALAQARVWPGMYELASLGVGLVARGLLAMGVAMLLGAIAGRTVPALVLAVILLVIWSVFAVPALQRQVAQERAVWQQDEDWRSGAGVLLYLRYATFDVTQAGRPSQPGKRIGPREVNALAVATCGEWPGEGATNRQRQANSECQESFWDSVQWSYAVPQSEFGLIQAADTAISLTLGGTAFLLTFAVVARRRPA